MESTMIGRPRGTLRGRPRRWLPSCKGAFPMVDYILGGDAQSNAWFQRPRSCLPTGRVANVRWTWGSPGKRKGAPIRGEGRLWGG